MTVAEQRYQAVLAVIGDGRTVKEVAAQWGVSRQTVHAWLARYEAGGLEGLVDLSRRPRSCPHQMPAVVEAVVLEMRRSRPYWGARRIAFEIGRRGLVVLFTPNRAHRGALVVCLHYLSTWNCDA